MKRSGPQNNKRCGDDLLWRVRSLQQATYDQSETIVRIQWDSCSLYMSGLRLEKQPSTGVRRAVGCEDIVVALWV